jgi:hypothetical protein
MFLMRADQFLGHVWKGLALEIETFLGPEMAQPPGRSQRKAEQST